MIFDSFGHALDKIKLSKAGTNRRFHYGEEYKNGQLLIELSPKYATSWCSRDYIPDYW